MEATSRLKSSIDSYNNALSNINLRIVIKAYELLKGIYLVFILTNLRRYYRYENSRRRGSRERY
jgi:hypothetical protein